MSQEHTVANIMRANGIDSRMNDAILGAKKIAFSPLQGVERKVKLWKRGRLLESNVRNSQWNARCYEGGCSSFASPCSASAGTGLPGLVASWNVSWNFVVGFSRRVFPDFKLTT